MQSGQTIAPMDSTFKLLGGGPTGSAGEVGRLAFALVASVAIVVVAALQRGAAQYGFAVRPVWAEVT